MAVSLLDEVQSAEFGDQRLTKRLGKVVVELGNKPNMSVPAATEGRAEMEAAYRFFDNDKVSPEKILQPHIESTRERIRQTKVALLAQDTTELDLTRPKQQVQGAGPLECESRRGAFFHRIVLRATVFASQLDATRTSVTQRSPAIDSCLSDSCDS